MKTGRAAMALYGAVLAISLFCLDACKSRATRSSTLRPAQCCAAYQHSDSLPDQPPPGVIRLAIGGDSRNDWRSPLAKSPVLPWAFQEAKRRAAKAFFFLGDMEITPSLDKLIIPELANLGGVPFYPLMGNHEVESLGIIRKTKAGSKDEVKEFKENFLMTPLVKCAPFDDLVAYSVDLEGGIHFIALDNVSRKHEGFGADQLRWLKQDLETASTANKVILVGMHKGLANNPATTHAMDEDGASAVKDSEAALALFHEHRVAMVFVSHSHMYAAYPQDGVEVRLTGGLGAPLVKGLAEADGGFHHFLLIDVPPGGNKTPLKVEVVKFPGESVRDTKDESEEID
jgi:Calcineurin-like phosphoesterase